jgi:hypothetical protein
MHGRLFRTNSARGFLSCVRYDVYIYNYDYKPWSDRACPTIVHSTTTIIRPFAASKPRDHSSFSNFEAAECHSFAQARR